MSKTYHSCDTSEPPTHACGKFVRSEGPIVPQLRASTKCAGHVLVVVAQTHRSKQDHTYLHGGRLWRGTSGRTGQGGRRGPSHLSLRGCTGPRG